MNAQPLKSADPFRVLARAQRLRSVALSPTERRLGALRLAVLLLAAAVAVLLMWRLLSGITPLFSAWLAQATLLQCGVVVAAVLLLAAQLSHRARLALQLTHSHSWLAAAPIASDILDRHHGLLLIRRFAVVVTLAASALTVLLVGAAASVQMCAAVLVTLLAAATTGTGFGWLFAGRTAGSGVGRLARHRDHLRKQGKAKATRIAPAVRGSGAAALARWPTARLAERCSGHLLARWLLPVFVMLPGNIGGAAALAMIAFCVALIVAVQMWLALRDIVPRAAAWLLSTPIPVRHFVWLLAQRALCVWTILAVLFAGAAMLIGLPVRGALQAALLIVAGGAASAALFMRRRNAAKLLDNRALAQLLAVTVAGVLGVPALIAALTVIAVIDFGRAVQT